MQIEANGATFPVDLDSLRQDVEDAQQQARQADIDEHHQLADAAYSTGAAGPATGDPFVEAGQRPVDGDAFADGGVEELESDDDDELSDLDETEDALDELFQQAEGLLADPDASKADVAEAMALMQQAAELGSSDAHNELGMAYLYGDLLPRNLSAAHHHFLEAADDGHAAAQHSLAFLYSLRLADPSSTAPSAAPLSILYDYFAATAGNVGAKLSMGYRHLHGYGVPKSCETAASFYRDVAQQVVDDFSGHAHHHLTAIDRAHLSEESARTSHMEDSAEVLQYYQHSAEGGNVEAQLTLGQLHYYGHRGLPHSPALAAKYFSQAAAAGDSNAMTNLGQMHLNGLIDSDGDVDSNATALSLFQAAADQGNPHAQTSLGLLYLTGGVVPINYTLAYHYFVEANKKRHPEAQFRLGVMHFTGLGVKPDMTQAYLFFSVSAHAGHIRALFNVAQMETHGLGVMRDCRAGVDKLKAVAERGEWSEDLGEGHELFLEGEYERSWLLYALAAHEGQEVGQSNAAWLIDRHYVQLWGKDADRFDVAYGLFRQSAEQKNFDSWRMMGDYAFYQLISNTTAAQPSSLSSLPPSTPSQPSSSSSLSSSSSSSSSPSPSSPSSSASSANSSHLSLAASHYSKASEKNAQASFDLGYMYHHGLGVPRDYPLAKRYYDQAITIDPNAVVPCKLALAKLWLDATVDDWTDWWTAAPDAQPRSGGQRNARQQDGGQSTPPQENANGGVRGEERRGGGQAVDGGGGVLSDVARRVFGADSVGWSWMEWYECAENVVLAVASVALAVCIYYRAQRM